VRLEAVLSASKKLLVPRETMSVFPGLPAFARLLDATIALHHSIDPDEEESFWTRIAIGLLRLVLEVVGDISMFWKR
jgi:hypothetical protein